MIGEMIEVAVSQPQANKVPTALRGLFQKPLGSVIGSIEENGWFRIFVGDQKAVCHRDAASVGENDHLATSSGIRTIPLHSLREPPCQHRRIIYLPLADQPILRERKSLKAWGCPAWPEHVSKTVNDLIIGGGVLFVHQAGDVSFHHRSSNRVSLSVGKVGNAQKIRISEMASASMSVSQLWRISSASYLALQTVANGSRNNVGRFAA